MTKRHPISRGMETHPYLFNTLAELPPALQHAAQPALETTEQPLKIFFVPAQSFLKNWFSQRYVPQQVLIFTAQGVLHVQEAASPDQPAQATYLRAVDLLYVQLRLLLLYGRLELAGQANGKLARVVVEFNTVGTWLLLPSLRQLLRLACGQTGAGVPAESLPEVTLPEFQKLSLKFKNGLRIYGLQPDESVQGLIFQPSIWKRRWPFFDQQVVANTLLALTDRAVVIVEENRTGEKSPYGWIFTYCPRECVKGMETTPGETRSELHLHLARAGVAVDRQLTLETEAALAWQNLWADHVEITKNPIISNKEQENCEQ